MTSINVWPTKDVNPQHLPILSIIVPCYNEEKILEYTITSLIELLERLINNSIISCNSYLLFVDDGSQDNTWEIIKDKSKEYRQVRGIRLALNSGHQNALLAGMEAVKDRCSCCITIDADLQDDISVIEEMVNFYKKGVEIVYGVRDNRDVDSFLKRTLSEGFYRIMALMGVDLVFNHADYRLLSQDVLKRVLVFTERNFFMRGIIRLVSSNTEIVKYKRKPRIAGETKYPYKKMFGFAWEGITAFSILPLRVVSIIGMIVSLLSFCMTVYIFSIALFTKNTVPGWASTVCIISFLGGLQILSIGIVGEYIGKIYKEVKHRPRYFVVEQTETL